VAAAVTPSPLIDAAILVVLSVVRNAGGTHLVRRGADLKPESGPALCGATGDLDKFHRPRWRHVHTARRVCNACHAKACAMPSRISWV
jgi:hypothetical protein